MHFTSLKYGGKSMEVVKNPSRLELFRTIVPTYEDYRGILLNGDIYLWDACGPLHYEMIKHIAEDKPDVFDGFIVLMARKSIQTYHYSNKDFVSMSKINPNYRQESVARLNTNHILKRLFPQFKVYYEYHEDNFITIEDLQNAAKEEV